MATITRRGDGWRVQVRRRGHRPESRTFPTKGQASAWGIEREAEILHGIRAPGKGRVADLLDRYAREVAPQRRGYRWEVVRLTLIGRYPIATVPLADLAPAHVAAFRDARGAEVGPSTVRRELALLGAVFEAARADWGLLAVNPCRGVRKPPPARPRDRLISPEEVTAMLAALGWQEAKPETAGQQVAAALLLALETGMRQGELLGLRWDRVGERVAQLERSKNGDARRVPLSPRAREVLELLRGLDHFRPLPVAPGTFDVLFRRAREAAGLAGFTFHDSRATAITRLAKRLDVLELARMVGHRDPRSLMVYYRESAEDIADRL
jgi:integrase